MDILDLWRIHLLCKFIINGYCLQADTTHACAIQEARYVYWMSQYYVQTSDKLHILYGLKKEYQIIQTNEQTENKQNKIEGKH